MNLNSKFCWRAGPLDVAICGACDKTFPISMKSSNKSNMDSPTEVLLFLLHIIFRFQGITGMMAKTRSVKYVN